MRSRNGRAIISIIIIIALVVTLCVLIKFTISDSSNVADTANNAQFGAFGNSNQDVEIISTIAVAKEKRGDEVVSNYDYKINLNSLTIEQGSNGVTINDTTIKITSAGTYYFYGTAKEANIVVEAGDEDNVVLVFDNANITSSTTAVINGVNAKNIYINLVKDSINTFTDGSKYTVLTGDDEPDATIYSKTDLLINGTGKLIINANYHNGISGKDDLVITNATLDITAKYNGIRGKDCVDIKDSTISVVAENDAIKSTNEDESDKGYVIIDNSKITLSAGDDAIHAETDLEINGESYIDTTNSHEGLEAEFIQINDGTIKIVSEDDAMNATNGSGEDTFGTQVSTNTRTQIQINGGDIWVKSAGDGIDSNANIIMTGGNVVVVGTTSNGNGALDYDGSFKLTGGSLVVYGVTGMWQNPSSTSTQYSLVFSNSGKNGDNVVIKDESGNIVAEFTTENSYSAILISNDKLEKGKTYTLYVNDTEIGSQELTNIVTSEVSGGTMGGPG